MTAVSVLVDDVVLQKVANVRACLRRIRDKTRLDPGSLQDIDVQDIVVLNLQRAVQSTIDLAAHVVASEGLGLPQTCRETFELLGRAGVTDPPLTRALGAMCGFRNVAIHDYAALDLAILQAILTLHLADLERFCARILARAGLPSA
jgi:uncharacterized protein YutE (UPF0331/DUF86 family)